MAKSFSQFICQQCGYQSPSFLGKCPECGEWNSLVETEVSDENLIRRSGGENLKFEEKLNEEFPTDQKYSYEQRGAQTMKTYSQEYTQEYSEGTKILIDFYQNW